MTTPRGKIIYVHQISCGVCGSVCSLGSGTCATCRAREQGWDYRPDTGWVCPSCWKKRKEAYQTNANHLRP